MLDLEEVRAVRSLVVHANCADGMLSAILVKDVVPDAEVHFTQYGNEQLALQAVPNMLFCDFSPHPSRVREFVDAGAMVLDHHRSARDIVAAFGERGCFGDEEQDPGVCGATLAYREVWWPLAQPGAQDDEFVRGLVRRAGIRDTWQTAEPEWDRACGDAQAFKFFDPDSWFTPYVFLQNQVWWEQRLGIGKRLFEKHKADVHRAIDKAYLYRTRRGTSVALFEGTALSSDAAEALDGVDLVVGFDYTAPDSRVQVIYSTRSRTDFNCAEFAKTCGGGGHTRAAGFSLSCDPLDPLVVSRDPYASFLARLEAWEGSHT